MPNRARQTRRPAGDTSGAGVGIDFHGGPVIDPTENVLALFDAGEKHQVELRTQEQRFRDELRAADCKYQDDMRAAETRRLNEKAEQKQLFDLEMARVLRANMDATTLLLATQVKEVKADVQVELRDLQRFRYETSGKTSGRDDVWKYIFAAAGLVATLIAFLAFMLRPAA